MGGLVLVIAWCCPYKLIHMSHYLEEGAASCYEREFD